MERARPLVAFSVGAAAGFGSGLLGIGGGIVMVPALVLLCGLPQHRAHGTSLAAIVPIGATGALVFSLGDLVNYAMAGLLALGAVAAAPLGVRLMARLPERALRLVFVAVLLAAGVRLLR